MCKLYRYYDKLMFILPSTFVLTATISLQYSNKAFVGNKSILYRSGKMYFTKISNFFLLFLPCEILKRFSFP